MSEIKHRSPIGIPQLDSLLGGGLPRGRISLLEGEAGAGKTILSTQTLIHGACQEDEPGLFVSFEETESELVSDMQPIGWNLVDLQNKGALSILGIDINPDTSVSGPFDLDGFLGLVDSKRREVNATRIVFDSIDLITFLIGDASLEKMEYYRLKNWIREHDLTCIVTSKPSRVLGGPQAEAAAQFLQHFSDVGISLRRDIIDRVPVRSLDVFKNRGGESGPSVIPFIFGPGGLQVANLPPAHISHPKASGRIRSGIDRLDAMLDGGYPRGASILISGSPGTAKSSLAVSALSGAAASGEKCLMVSFDEGPEQIVRNAKSIGIDLKPHIEGGQLVIESLRVEAISVEAIIISVLSIIKREAPRVIAIDPVSSLMNAPGRAHPMNPVQRLLDYSKSHGIISILTSLTDSYDVDMAPDTTADISTIADTWLHLDFLSRAGERNRSIAVLKSRGTRHSSQVRELLLSDDGIALAEVFTAGGDVLMGTARIEKEMELKKTETERDEAVETRRTELASARDQLMADMRRLQELIDLKSREMDELEASETRRKTRKEKQRDAIYAARGGDE